ncbi:hypothetical protein [Mesorhizobium sp. BH1-1-4]|uniref:hypothetical protein n=1 Tax=Mesorhizobium sp. BH1-1-4 TaxID=2876662 RepID=UPI001CD11C99|nr:hypothetical protein [Mesorhizobium sp. BH1-1-4]MBZ9997321.1 hypothetical protein [Mesorhizobium sp. BH1-1-4]
MFADLLSRKAGGLEVVGFNIPEWGLVSSKQEIPEGESITTGRVHRVDVDTLASRVLAGGVEWIDVDAYAMRLEYFAEDRLRFAKVFSSSLGQRVNEDEIAISIRSGDIVDGLHPDYTPIPLAFYHRIVFETGLKPVFVGQTTGNWYADALRRQFGAARFVESEPLSDFQTLRRAKNAVVAVSSFSWLASFLSTETSEIHLPVAGLFNSNQRPDIDLLPKTDKRYRFYYFQPERYVASDSQRRILTRAPAWPVARAEQDDSYMGLHSISSGPKILAPKEVASRIREAADQSAPFCFVRLGDGEGSLLQFEPSIAKETDFAYFRDHFGNGISPETILSVQAGLRRTIDAADLIGLRDDVWLTTNSVDFLDEDDPEFYVRFRSDFPLRSREREYIDDHGARRIFRLFQWARASYPVGVEACSQWVAYDLAISGFWADFLRSRKSITLIHCSPYLPAKIRDAVGTHVESILVPEKAVQQARWRIAPFGMKPHYPDVFKQVCDKINTPAEGKVFLVGAGLAGKEYLKIIRDNGGIALDLGALLDAWDGRTTRPQIFAHKTGNRWAQGEHVPPEFSLHKSP